MKQRFVKPLLVLATALGVTACGGGGGGAIGGAVGGGGGTADCSTAGQIQFVLDTMRDVYLYDNQLPANPDTSQATVEEFLADLIAGVDVTPDDMDVKPDTFSFIDSAAADAAFFGEGQFVGFGFSSTDIENDGVRFTRVFGGSPADLGGLERGQRLLAVDGTSVDELRNQPGGIGGAFGPSEEGIVRTLTIENPDSSTFDAVLTKAVVTINPVPQVRTYTINGNNFGYIEFSTFISTAQDPLEDAFAQFNQVGITDVILDLRYNGGGLVSIAELLGDYLGGAIAEGLVFSETLFNENNAASNNVELFARLANSSNLSRLVVITTRGSASASELVINSMLPHVQVQLVGQDTFGKPVGQVGVEFCEKILRPTAFETVNSLGEGRYFDGLPVDCAAADDLTLPTGNDQEASTFAALSLLSTGSCPSATVTSKPDAPIVPFRPLPGDDAAKTQAYAW